MKYMLLIYQNRAAFATMPADERTAVMNDAGTLVDELIASGELLGGEGLADPSNARTVRVRDGVPAITDGPFIEAKEQLAGYCLLECETAERATEIAVRWPDARHWAVELWPLMTEAGTEM